jgi:HEPN domain-containing protein
LFQDEEVLEIISHGILMKPELWLNRADHELVLAKELLGAGSLLWAVSYAHRSLEYALEGLIVLKTGERPERGSRLAELQTLSRSYLPDLVIPAIDDLVALTPIVWQSDVREESIRSLTENHSRKIIDGAGQVITWIGEEWERSNGSELQSGT